MTPAATPEPDLSLCEREPIEFPEAAQPHGALLALTGASLVVERASANTGDLLGRPPQALLGLPLDVALGGGLAAAVRTATDAGVNPAQPVAFPWGDSAPGRPGYWCSLHRSGERLVLDLEPNPPAWSAADTAVRATQALARMQTVRAEAALEAKLAAAADLFRALTGYDRAMIYRFDPVDWQGAVVAESRADDCESYLGLHYPASDIPAQARALYQRSPTRVISDVDAPAAPLLAAPDAADGAPLDLSLSALRAVAPVHLEYLRNMGVRATLTGSLVADGRLLGLVACHHRSPRLLPGKLRDLVGWLAQDLATQIALVEARTSARRRARLKACRERVIAGMRAGAGLADLILGPQLSDVLGAVAATGVALVQQDSVVVGGVTPPPGRCAQIAGSLADRVGSPGMGLFATDCLSRELPGSEDLAATAAGALMQPLAVDRELKMLCFRGELLREVTWGGDPHKAGIAGGDGRISPRQSFAAWRETVRLHARRWLDEEVESAREFGVLIDVESLRVAEAARDAALAKYQALFQHFPLGITVCDHDGTIVETNPASEQMLGVGVAEQTGRHIDAPEWSIQRPDATPLPAAEYASVRACRERLATRDQEMLLVGPGGERRWLNVSAAPLSVGNLGALVVCEDITERKRIEARREAEAALRESERRFRIMADELPVLVWVNDPDLNCTMINKTYRDYFGLPEAACLGHQWLDVLHPDDFDAYCQAFFAKLGLGESFQGQCRGRRADGAWRWLETYARPFYSENGQLAGVVGTTLDITDRKAAEDALHDSNRALAHHAEQLGRLTSALTLAEQRERERLAKVLHDHLQQLLVGATMGVERLARRLQKAGLVDAPDSAGAEVDAALASLKDLLRQALESARTLVADLGPPILHEVGLDAALEWLARTMEDNYGLSVSLTSDADIPSQPDDVRSVLFECVREALFNIVKHAGSRGAQVCSYCDRDGRFCIEVRDAGSGFDTARLTVADSDGTGFGILAMRERLRCLGGRCEIESSPGAGTRVVLRAPLDTTVRSGAGLAAEARGESAVAGAQGTGELGPETQVQVLLVDDHAMVRQGLRALLADEPNLTVVGEACDGIEALERVDELKPRLVLMDYSMPRMDGLEATRQLKQQHPEVCVIGLSMYQEADRAAAMLRAGAGAYVDKTAGADALLTTIREQLPSCGIAPSAPTSKGPADGN